MNELSTKNVHATFIEVVCDITLQDAWGWYHHCGYVRGCSLIVDMDNTCNQMYVSSLSRQGITKKNCLAIFLACQRGHKCEQ